MAAVRAEEGTNPSAACAPRGMGAEGIVTSSSQTNMCLCPVNCNYRSVVREHQALVDMAAFSLLQKRIG
jgi:hypothetical protein